MVLGNHGYHARRVIGRQEISEPLPPPAAPELPEPWNEDGGGIGFGEIELGTKGIATSNKSLLITRALLLVARMLLVAPGLTTSNKDAIRWRPLLWGKHPPGVCGDFCMFKQNRPA